MFASSARPPGFSAAPSTGARVVAANGSKITEFNVDTLTGCPSTSLALPLSPRSKRTSWHEIASRMRPRPRAAAGSMKAGWVTLGGPSGRQCAITQAQQAKRPRMGAHAGRDAVDGCISAFSAVWSRIRFVLHLHLSALSAFWSRTPMVSHLDASPWSLSFSSQLLLGLGRLSCFRVTTLQSGWQPYSHSFDDALHHLSRGHGSNKFDYDTDDNTNEYECLTLSA